MNRLCIEMTHSRRRKDGRVCRAKGYAHRARAVAFGVLAHNLWWIARRIREREKESRLQAA